MKLFASVFMLQACMNVFGTHVYPSRKALLGGTPPSSRDSVIGGLVAADGEGDFCANIHTFGTCYWWHDASI